MDSAASSGGPITGVFVTGTDTGIGKTRVTAGLVRALTLRRCRAAGLKPVVSGALSTVTASGEGAIATKWWEDLDVLAQAGGPAMDDGLRAVARLDLPASPHIASEREGCVLRLGDLIRGVDAAYQAAGLQFAVVEGVGGFCVPLAPGLDTADLAQALELPVIMVVGLRLGCINHAVLTAAAIRSRGLKLTGWVANVGLTNDYPFIDETIATIESCVDTACSAQLGTLPLANAEDVRTDAERADYRRSLEAQVSAAAGYLGSLAMQLWPE